MVLCDTTVLGGHHVGVVLLGNVLLHLLVAVVGIVLGHVRVVLLLLLVLLLPVVHVRVVELAVAPTVAVVVAAGLVLDVPGKQRQGVEEGQ